MFYLNPYIQGKSEEKDNAFDLSLILEKAANYCQKLDQASLHFVCHEEVKEYIYFVEYAPNYIDNTYVYDYQLIKKGMSHREMRALIEENGQSTYLEKPG